MVPPVDPEENSRKMVPIHIIAACAKQAGWTGQDAIIATAVAMAESGGDRTAVGRAVPSRPDYGLWQVNYIHNDEFLNFFPPGVGWKNILINAAAAKKVWDSQGWSIGWTTFRSGAYSKYLSQAQTGAAQPLTPIESQLILEGTAGDINVPIPDAIGNVASDAINAAAGAIFKEYGPYLWIAGGSVLVLLGVLLLAKDTDIGKAALSAAKVAAL